MEIKRTKEVIDFAIEIGVMASYDRVIIEKSHRDKKWVALDDDIKEALSLYFHVKNHTEVQKAPTYKGMPICKICDKSAYQIMCEEWESLSKSDISKVKK